MKGVLGPRCDPDLSEASNEREIQEIKAEIEAWEAARMWQKALVTEKTVPELMEAYQLLEEDDQHGHIPASTMWAFTLKTAEENFGQENYEILAQQCLLLADPRPEFSLDKPSFAAFEIPREEDGETSLVVP